MEIRKLSNKRYLLTFRNDSDKTSKVYLAVPSYTHSGEGYSPRYGSHACKSCAGRFKCNYEYSNDSNDYLCNRLGSIIGKSIVRFKKFNLLNERYSIYSQYYAHYRYEQERINEAETGK